MTAREWEWAFRINVLLNALWWAGWGFIGGLLYCHYRGAP